MAQINIINTDKMDIEYKIEIHYYGRNDDREYGSDYKSGWKKLKNDVHGYTFHVPGIITVPEVYVYLKYDDTITKFKFVNIINTNTMHFTFHKGTNYPYVRINNQSNTKYVTCTYCSAWLVTIFCFPCGGCCICGSPEREASCYSLDTPDEL